MLVFFLHSVTNCRALSTQVFRAQWSTASEAFGGLTLPTGVMKLFDQSLKSIETSNLVLSFLKMSLKLAVTFFSAPYSNG